MLVLTRLCVGLILNLSYHDELMVALVKLLFHLLHLV